MLGVGTLASGNEILLKPAEGKTYDRHHRLQQPILQTTDTLPGRQMTRMRPNGQLEWKLPVAAQSGSYQVGVWFADENFFTFNEILARRCALYLNDQPLPWTAYGIPQKSGSKRSLYTSRLISATVSLKAGDIIRVTCQQWTWLGPLWLSRTGFQESTIKLPEHVSSRFQLLPKTECIVEWGKTARSDKAISQTVNFYNASSLAKTYRIETVALDWFRNTLLKKQESVTLAPGKKLQRVLSFSQGNSGRTSLAVTVTAPSHLPSHRIKFFVDDITQGPRRRLWLNENWRYRLLPLSTTEIGQPPQADTDWQAISIPAYLPKDKSHCAWLKKTLIAPDFLKGERYLLKFDSLLYEGWIYVNGQLVKHQRHGTEPFEIDITEAFRPGRKNTILVGLRDWTAYSPVNRQKIAAGQAARCRIDMITPVGHTADWQGYGLNGLIRLETRPAVAIKDLFVVTDVERKRLKLTYTLENTGSTAARLSVRPNVLDQGEKRLCLKAETITLPPKSQKVVAFEKKWRNPVLWEPGKPYLYILQTTLGDGKLGDTHYQRFGFRDIKIDGTHFVVNGRRMKIRSQWNREASGGGRYKRLTSPEKRLELIWERQKDHVTSRAVQLSRTHNMQSVSEICDMADETGLMLKVEDGNFCQVDFTRDSRFWESGLQGELSMINAYKNHPSIFMWSAGNENVWCFGYKGPEILKFAYENMFKIQTAMEEFDLQGRPVEWEADSDLNGQSRYHALHYPRELSHGATTLPNDAWYGPLDGKSEIKYPFHNVKLGRKPISVGEAHWPAYINHPHGSSVLLGDRNYLGGWFWYKAWLDSCHAFIDGYRDAEFALVDVYSPLSFIKPQSIVSKERSRQFFGGRTLVRHLNLHNDIRESARFQLRWRLERQDGTTFASGQKSVRLAPAELKRLELEIPLPRVSEKIAANFRLELVANDRIVDQTQQDWDIFPPYQVSAARAVAIPVFDPEGDTLQALTNIGVRTMSLPDLSQLTGTSLILGTNALAKLDEEEARKQLQQFVLKGGKVAILNQEKMPEFILPFSSIQVAGSTSSVAFNRAPDHPIMSSLDDQDLRYWPSDHLVSRQNFRKPTLGNWLPLMDCGTIEGCVDTPLFEEYLGKGSYVVCQLLLTEKHGVSPVAARLLGNMVNYLLLPKPFRQPGKTAVLAGAPLLKALTKTRLDFENLDGKVAKLAGGQFKTVILSASTSLQAADIDLLRDFVNQGGTLMVQDVTPDNQKTVEKLTGVKLVLDSCATSGKDVKNHVIRTTNHGLLSGISNHELIWPSGTYLKALRQEGCWWSFNCDIPESETIASYFCRPESADSAKTTILTEPCVLLKLPLGKGAIIVNQLNYSSPIDEVKMRVSRLVSLLLTNLNGTIKASGQLNRLRKQRLNSYQFSPIDLTRYANRGLRDDKKNGITGWTNQGPNDMRNLPTGSQVFNGVPFVVPTTPKAVITLYAKSSDNTELPESVNIRVNKKADALFFMHSMAWGGYPQPFRYAINYQDGTREVLNMYRGQHVIDWWGDSMKFADRMAMSNTVVAWKGPNGVNRDGVSIYCVEWLNPHPENAIVSVDFMTTPASGYVPIPVLVGLTAAVKSGEQRSLPTQGKIVGLLGTHGFKIQTDNGLAEVYAIGIKNQLPTEAYYAEATTQIKRLCLNQDIVIRYGAVKHDPEDRLIAYLYFKGDDANITSSINSKLVGDGICDISNFHGNAPYQSYFNNLQSIAKANKMGLWR
jgi:hypothetical protein